jgi:hypothetical protein
VFSAEKTRPKDWVWDADIAGVVYLANGLKLCSMPQNYRIGAVAPIV